MSLADRIATVNSGADAQVTGIAGNVLPRMSCIYRIHPANPCGATICRIWRWSEALVGLPNPVILKRTPTSAFVPDS